MIIDLSQIPEEGLDLQGVYSRDILDLGEKDSARPDPDRPAWYDVHVQRAGDELLLTGEVGAGVLLVCARCMEQFRDELKLDDYRLEVTIEDRGSIDLTERIREDILLALPWYPHCAESTVESRQCTGVEAIDKIAENSMFSADESGDDPGAGGSGVWSALDGLSDPKN